MPITKLQENLERRFNREFKHQYLAKLPEKVARQTLVEIDRAQIEQRMAFTRENYRMDREKLMEIMYWDKDAHPGERPPQKRDVVEAAKSVAMLDLALLKAEIETGMYKKPIEKLAADIRYDPPTDGSAATCCRPSTSGTAGASSSATGCTPTGSWRG
jgi:hypothetical protein